MADTNQLALAGRISELDALRHTPAGIALLDFRIAHESEQTEAGTARQVRLDVACLATEREARLLAAAPLGAKVALRGFLAPRGRSSRQLVLHVTSFEFV
ncbi:MAG: primosomal replication protein N [Burkholderiales bacterium]|nr:primosomal replication protein N [Burkholderiales bacterium]